MADYSEGLLCRMKVVNLTMMSRTSLSNRLTSDMAQYVKLDYKYNRISDSSVH